MKSSTINFRRLELLAFRSRMRGSSLMFRAYQTHGLPGAAQCELDDALLWRRECRRIERLAERSPISAGAANLGAGYVCPQCGPDATGPEVHQLTHHTL